MEKAFIAMTAFATLCVFAAMLSKSNRKIILSQQEEIARLKGLIEAQRILIALYQKALEGGEE